MRLSEIWRRVSNKPELAIYGPIRLDYRLEDVDKNEARKTLGKRRRETWARALAGQKTSEAISMEALLRSIFGEGMIVHDRPATIIDVVEYQQRVGYYRGSGKSALHLQSAMHLRFDIEILRPGVGKEMVARKTFDVQPPEKIVSLGRPQAGEISGRFPRQEIEKWLRSFPFQVAE